MHDSQKCAYLRRAEKSMQQRRRQPHPPPALQTGGGLHTHHHQWNSAHRPWRTCDLLQR
jgi:hypothetical protein